MISTGKPVHTLLALVSVLAVASGAQPALARPDHAAPTAAATEHSHLSWTPCRTLVHGWDPGDKRTECATVSVPVDYARPQGRTIRLMISRLKATSPARRRGVVLINPGGPGNSGLEMPGFLSRTSVAGIGTDHDLIGFDPRGIGFSGGKRCDPSPEDGPAPDPKASARVQFAQEYRQNARYNKRCAGYDPAYIAGLSTTVMARDMDRIRVALGEEKIGFYGISWGTALGVVYRSLYDRHVDRMLLDSVMPPDFSLKAMNDGPVAAAEADFARFARWVATRNRRYHLGRTAPAVTGTVLGLARQLDRHPRTLTLPDGRSVTFGVGALRTIMGYPRGRWPDMATSVVALRHGGVPPLLGDEEGGERASRHTGLVDSVDSGLLPQISVLCNDQGADPDEHTLWRQEQRRVASSPLFNSLAGYESWCAGWPLPAQPWHLRRGTSTVQFVGHRYETTTPYPWARKMRRRVGGALLTVEDGVHGSLLQTPCGSRAVEFFSTGRLFEGTCPGVPGH
ncbi:alpha/beta fold hydrolase (plasmid) [Streptomyces sp. FXJ1.172]|uniref:alpha/beta fold hydrolase n=1 Tax=Streptomyces sp. FXJ1.172 TaxID=710705 RepID=UPI0023DD008F|nr:alpha/beta fold hydrolase [Streptomyces sp. FXJ1.172]WEP00837.1 alpha/beta fold hydrolase [Streptomyces sp. FXJ1.172]